MTDKTKLPAAVELGTRGGRAKSPAKAAAARANGKKGGRPRLNVAATPTKTKSEKSWNF